MLEGLHARAYSVREIHAECQVSIKLSLDWWGGRDCLTNSLSFSPPIYAEIRDSNSTSQLNDGLQDLVFHVECQRKSERRDARMRMKAKPRSCAGRGLHGVRKDEGLGESAFSAGADQPGNRTVAVAKAARGDGSQSRHGMNQITNLQNTARKHCYSFAAIFSPFA